MNNYILRILFVLIPSFIAMLYGIIKVFPKTKGLYFRMATLAMACIFAGYLSSLVMNLSDTPAATDVNISILGSVGLSLFLLTQNADHISSLLYEPGKHYQKIKLLSFIAPFIIFLLFIGFEVLFYRENFDYGFSFWFGKVGLLSLCALLNAVTAYYTSRYSMSPDPDNGLVACLRPYNIVMTLLLVLFTPEQFIRYQDVDSIGAAIAIMVYYLGLAIVILVVLPLMERGRLKFLTSL